MTRIRFLCAIAAAAILAPLHSADLSVTKPEDVGFSSQRLRRIHEMVMRHIDDHEISGAVTIVARRGRVVQYDAAGLLDLDSKKPMPRDALFRLASSSKPITTAAVLILMEEGKLRLTDPVWKFIPEFRNARVAVEDERQARPMADISPVRKTVTVPAEREIDIIDLLTHTSGLATS